MKQTIAIFGAAMLLSPLAAAAAINNVCDVLDLVQTAAGWFSFLVFILAIIAILYAGFLFLTSGGNEETTKKARTTLIYALIGIAVALLATTAVNFVEQTIGGGLNNSCVGVS